MTVPTGALPAGFDLVDRLHAAALGVDEMPIGDLEALLREAATVIEVLKKALRDRRLATVEPAGRA